MARLVIVSNRVPVPRSRGTASAGGLAVGLKDALVTRAALWFGWSGHIARQSEAPPAMIRSGRTTYATIDLTEAEHRAYYTGFSNGTLWPLLHWRMGLAEFDRDHFTAYRAVNQRFAQALAPLLEPEDLVWVHDFHLVPMGAALRERGVTQPIGFFLHVPFPPPALFGALPEAATLLHDLGAYDLIGVQTDMDRDFLRSALAALEIAARVETFPIGIDAEGFAQEAALAAAGTDALRLAESLGDRALILGVDRLDYSKGLPHRLRGFARLLARFPEHRRRVTFLQVAPVSRGEVAQYRALKRELDELAGQINGAHGEVDWIPLRWITRAVPRATLAGFHRLARVCLVTPLRDGMNLVAKEFVAAQDRNDPGVLVLSSFAGAAAELTGAVQVNPHDPEAIAEALHTALTMEPSTRHDRWQADFNVICRNSAAAWAQRFLAALEQPSPAPRQPVATRAQLAPPEPGFTATLPAR